jgi:hypothetical protein
VHPPADPRQTRLVALRFVRRAWARFRSWRLWVQLLVAFLLFSLAVGPFLPEEDGGERVSAVATTTTTVKRRATTTTAQRSTTTDAAPRSTSAMSESTTTRPTTTTTRRITLTGYGATRKVWDQHHKKARGYSDGSAYQPLLEDGQPQYAAVFGDEAIISYTLYMPYNSTLETTQLRVRNEFPQDATPRPLQHLGECEAQEWFSPTVERALGDGYIPLVAYYPPDPTYPKAEQRWMAIFTITKPNEENLC